MSKIKNILILVIIGAILVFAYLLYIKNNTSGEADLVSSSNSTALNTTKEDVNSSISQDFLTLLLGVKGLKLDDTIFSDIAFTSLDGSHSIILTPDGTEGRVNPFAPLGTDVAVTN